MRYNPNRKINKRILTDKQRRDLSIGLEKQGEKANGVEKRDIPAYRSWQGMKTRCYNQKSSKRISIIKKGGQ